MKVYYWLAKFDGPVIGVVEADSVLEATSKVDSYGSDLYELETGVYEFGDDSFFTGEDGLRELRKSIADAIIDDVDSGMQMLLRVEA